MTRLRVFHNFCCIEKNLTEHNKHKLMKPYCEETFLYIGLFAFMTWLVRQTNEDDEALALDHQFYMLHGHFAYHTITQFQWIFGPENHPHLLKSKKLNTHDILSLPFCVFPPLTSRLTLKVQAVGFVGQQHQTELPCYSLVVETYPIQTGQLPHRIVVKTCLKPPHSHIGLLLPWTAKVLLLYPLHQTLEAANFPAKHLNCQFPPRVRQAKRVTEYQQISKNRQASTKKRRSSIFVKGAAKGTHSPPCFTNHDSAKRPATLDTMTTGHGHHHLGKHALSCSVVWNRWVLLRLIIVYSFLTYASDTCGHIKIAIPNLTRLYNSWWLILNIK